MTCHNCRIEMVKAGTFGKKRIQRYKCQQCGKRFAEPQETSFGADVRPPAEKVTMILHCLVEGNSIRSTGRLCDVEKRTVLNLLKLAGENCERFMAQHIQAVPVKHLELDEVWTFVGKKQKRLTPEDDESRTGDAYTYIAVEQSTKMVMAWHLGKRDGIISTLRTSSRRCDGPPLQMNLIFQRTHLLRMHLQSIYGTS